MTEENNTEEQVGETETGEIEVPLRWNQLPLQQMLNDGWMPRIRKIKGREYLTLRLGNKEKSLGPCSDEIINLFLDKFPQVTIADFERRQAPHKSALLDARIAKPAPLKTHVQISLLALRYYEVLKENGYPGELSDFINEIIVTHFQKCHGIVLPVVYTQPMVR